MKTADLLRGEEERSADDKNETMTLTSCSHCRNYAASKNHQSRKIDPGIIKRKTKPSFKYKNKHKRQKQDSK